MKANEFVKKYGWSRAKQILSDGNGYSSFQASDIVATFIYGVKDGYILIDDLKRLVESWGLVCEHGSVQKAKNYADSKYTAPEIAERLKQAIADVESCND